MIMGVKGELVIISKGCAKGRGVKKFVPDTRSLLFFQKVVDSFNIDRGSAEEVRLSEEENLN